MKANQRRIIVVSNRLPFVLKQDRNDAWSVEPGAGGLVTALIPVLSRHGGTWIGWPGTDGDPAEVDRVLDDAGADLGYELKAVHLSQEEVHNFYYGFSNEVVWPLFHDLQTVCNFDPLYWRTYCEVNRKFARSVAANSAKGDFIWVHDYHLMNVAAELRRLGSQAKVGFFLHIPFPSVDLFSKLPWAQQLLEALVQYDLIGFQTAHDRDNFEQCVQELMPGLAFQPRGDTATALVGGREVTVGSFPISIDFNAFMSGAMAPEVQAKAQELRRMLPNRTLVLGVDRLDYTKGIPHRLKAFHHLLQDHPELRGKISLIQVVVPSREKIPEYDALKTAIDQLVGRINGEFGRPGSWVPVWYVYDNLTTTDLLAYYRAADIALITPLRDGMNLVAKEFCASSIEEECVLVLSKFAGAAAQLGEHALLVNPYDIEGVSDALLQAFEMSPAEKRQRMDGLRRSIARDDIYRWAESFMEAARAGRRDGERTSQQDERARGQDERARTQATRPRAGTLVAVPRSGAYAGMHQHDTAMPLKGLPRF